MLICIFYNILEFILGHMNGVINSLIDFLRPFFISVFAFSIPFLYNARLNLDKRYKTSLVSKKFAETNRYHFFWTMNIIAFSISLSFVLFRDQIRLTPILYLVCTGLLALFFILYIISIALLYSGFVKLGEFTHTTELIKNEIKDSTPLDTYKNTYNKVTQVSRWLTNAHNSAFNVMKKFLHRTKRASIRLMAFVRIVNGRYIFKISILRDNRIESVANKIDKDNKRNFEYILKIWEYAIKNQDNIVFNQAREVTQKIVQYYQYLQRNETEVTYPQWFYDDISTIIKDTFVNNSTISFDTQLYNILRLYLEDDFHAHLSFRTIHEIDKCMDLAIKYQRSEFIKYFLQLAEIYYLNPIQRDEVANWNKRGQNKFIPFADNPAFVWALFVYVLRAKLFAAHFYQPLLETENFVGVRRTPNSKHLYRMTIEEILQMYIMANSACTGYSFVFANIYPYIFWDNKTFIKQLNEYTAFLILKNGKEINIDSIKQTVSAVPNELLPRYFSQLKQIIVEIKRDYKLMAMFRLDGSVDEKILDEIQDAFKQNKAEELRKKPICNIKEKQFVEISKDWLNSTLLELNVLFDSESSAGEKKNKIELEPIHINIDKRAFVEQADLDAQSVLYAPANFFARYFIERIFKTLHARTKDEHRIVIDEMSEIEDAIKQHVGNNAKDYIFIDFSLPYYTPKGNKFLQAIDRTYSYEGIKFIKVESWMLDDLSQSLLIIKKQDVLSLANKNDIQERHIGDGLLNTYYKIEPDNNTTGQEPSVRVTMGSSKDVYYSEDMEVYQIKVNQQW